MPEIIKKLTIDTWKTDLHGEEIGIKQKEQWMSKSRAFTRDMDIIGRIIEDEKNMGLLCIRKNIWSGKSREGESNKLDSRLILRIFSDSGQWKGSIEEMVTWELGQSIAVDNPLPQFTAIMPIYDYVVPIRKVHQRATIRENYSFELINAKNFNVDIFELRSERISIGSDWNVLYRNIKGEKKIADLDTKKLDLGGKVHIKIYEKQFADNEPLKTSLILFSSTIRYQDEIKNNIKNRLESVRKGELKISPKKSELWLMRNPRRYVSDVKKWREI
jgi:hypothetical protein